MRLFVPMMLVLGLAACGPPKAVPASEVVLDLARFRGKVVDIKTKLKSGARCRQGEDGEWKTYCKDCVYCRGPVVVDLGGTSTSTAVDDWPMILGGTWEMKDIRCKGPLNEVECYPFTPGKEYVIRGVIEWTRPPKLLVEKFWAVD